MNINIGIFFKELRKRRRVGFVILYNVENKKRKEISVQER